MIDTAAMWGTQPILRELFPQDAPPEDLHASQTGAKQHVLVVQGTASG
jgi:hypothetical protein